MKRKEQEKEPSKNQSTVSKSHQTKPQPPSPNSSSTHQIKSSSLPNNLHKLHPPLPIHFRPHGKRHLHPAPQVRALPLHVSEHGDVFAVGERRLDVELQTGAVLAHVAEGLRDGVRARVRLGGVAAGALFGFGDVPV